MKNLKNLLGLIGLMTLVSCGSGPQGGSFEERLNNLESCDVVKEEVKQVLSGSSKNCSSFVSSALTAEEAEESLDGLFEGTNADEWVSLHNGTWFSIKKIGNKILAVSGAVNWTSDEEGTDGINVDVIALGRGIPSRLTEIDEDSFTLTEDADLENTETITRVFSLPFSRDEIKDEDILMITTETTPEMIEAFLSN